MNLNERKELLIRLGTHLLSKDETLEQVKQKAYMENNWFTNEFVNLALKNVAHSYLQPQELDKLVSRYAIPGSLNNPRRVGIVMAGNIPMVGFHDFLCVFLSGHIAVVKPSSKDEALMKHAIDKLIEWDKRVEEIVLVQEMLKNCDAYIATGSNNSGRYFEYYFQKYPHIIRKNRTSVAILTGQESKEDLEKLADDVHLYFGLGCRNISKIFVPEGYDFIPLLDAFRKYSYLFDHNKYRNNYDYHLASYILNNRFYMTSDSVLLVEEKALFAPIAQLNYEYYKNQDEVFERLNGDESVQCLVGKTGVHFGDAQCPQVCDFADGVDTMRFLLELNNRGKE